VPEGALFYAETRRRVAVPFDADLRRLTEQTALQFGALFATGSTPPAVGGSLSRLFAHRGVPAEGGARSALGFRARAIDAVLDGDGLAE
jgi:CRISPR-associated exonuclease Cas4